MTRDEFAKQFIEGAASRGVKKEAIAKTLPTALADFDAQNAPQQKSAGNILTNILGINADKFQQGQQEIGQSNANPLLKAGATAQNALANSGEILPLIYSAALRAAVPIPGLSTGVGAMLGQRLQQVNQRGGIEALLPNQQESGQALGKGVAYGGAELVGSGIGQVAQKITKPAKALLQNPFPKGAAKNLHLGAEKAVARGEKIGWDTGENNLVEQITKAVKDKLTWNKEVKDATGNLIGNLTPVPPTITGENGLAQIGQGVFNPNELLKTRSQLTQTTGQKIFSVLQGKGSAVDDKVAAIARNVISKNLHKLAPETLNPDIALSMYNKLGLVGKLGLPGVVGGAVLGKQAIGGATNLLGMLGINQ
jgi:hypothetical protein